MAYDRYDTRRERGSSRDSDYGDRSDRGGRREERGFFERAGNEIASWFGDDDDDRSRRQERSGRGGDWFGGDDDRERGRREGGRGWAPQHGWGGDPDPARGDTDRDPRGWRDSDRSRDRDDDQRSSSRPMNWTSSNEDYRSGSNRGWGERQGGYRPMTGDYGRSEDERGGQSPSQSPWGRDDYRRTSFAGSASSGGSGREHDRHYHEWRQRQLDELDRDYDDYHRERQQHFENDFGSWRQTRQQKRQMLGGAREQMTVVGSDGETVGKVDCIRGDRVILTKNDSPDGRHHSIPCTMIDTIEEDRIKLDCTAEEAKGRWRDEDQERALFERDDQGEGGAHMLNRSFSGTYR